MCDIKVGRPAWAGSKFLNHLPPSMLPVDGWRFVLHMGSNMEEDCPRDEKLEIRRHESHAADFIDGSAARLRHAHVRCMHVYCEQHVGRVSPVYKTTT